jgi:hypothetical protein
MFARILVVLDDAKIRLDMQAAHRAPLQRDDVVHDMQASSSPRHVCRDVPHGQVTRTMKSPRASSSFLM